MEFACFRFPQLQWNPYSYGGLKKMPHSRLILLALTVDGEAMPESKSMERFAFAFWLQGDEQQWASVALVQ
jgi:hypothetical protein